MRPCVIFNPAAKGEKSRRFRVELDHLAAGSVFKLTGAPGHARRLAAEAVREGHEIVVAAGGDGTLNEVLNGIGDVSGGFQRTRLGFIPLGTVNVFARELGIPLTPHGAWEVITAGHEIRVDLPWIERLSEGRTVRRYFSQLAGAGLDARAIELVDWQTKKQVGPWAYVLAGLRALGERPPSISARTNQAEAAGQLILIGNGRLYGGGFRIFPEGDLRSGVLEVCVFPRISWLTLLRCGLPLLLTGRLPDGLVRRLRGDAVRLESSVAAPVEVDGESAGYLPVAFGLKPQGLRVLVPASAGVGRPPLSAHGPDGPSSEEEPKGSP
ncbi:MAG: diacylglycerol kinase family lipid kinase [Verrucomicrobia bacterium]|nr:diacylglycerol kinase family lipid kinase [Verrucomicrobiota bacterium]